MFDNVSCTLVTMVVMATVLGFQQTVSARQCYGCHACRNTTTAQPITCPNEDDLCSSFATYVRNNQSIPWNNKINLASGSLECIELTRKSGWCDLDPTRGIVMNKCWVSPSGYELNCIDCCDRDNCNDYIVDWNTKDSSSSSLNVKASTISIFISVLVVLWMS